MSLASWRYALVVVFGHLRHLHQYSSWVRAKKVCFVVPRNVFSWQALEVDHCCVLTVVVAAKLMAVLVAVLTTVLKTLLMIQKVQFSYLLCVFMRINEY